MALETNSHRALLFSASDIDVLKSNVIDRHPFLVKLGPDIFDENLSWKIISKRLISEKFKNRQLASLFLDQKFLAGIGNYLRSEILFEARVNPLKKPRELTKKDINQLSRSTLKICQRAYIQGGVTNSEELMRILKNEGLSKRACRHAVFGRSDDDCYVCKTSIIKVSVGSRRLYLCPSCQNEN